MRDVTGGRDRGLESRGADVGPSATCLLISTSFLAIYEFRD